MDMAPGYRGFMMLHVVTQVQHCGLSVLQSKTPQETCLRRPGFISMPHIPL